MDLVKGDDLSYALSKLGWSQKQFAERMDVHPNTVSGWVTGRVPVPGSVSAYIDLVLRVKGLLDE